MSVELNQRSDMMMMNENLLNTDKQHLTFNANKVRWLTDSQTTPADTFVIGSGEKAVIDLNLPCSIKIQFKKKFKKIYIT